MNQSEAIESGLSIIRKSELDAPTPNPRMIKLFEEFLRTQLWINPEEIDSGTFYLLYREYEDSDNFLIWLDILNY